MKPSQKKNADGTWRATIAGNRTSSQSASADGAFLENADMSDAPVASQSVCDDGTYQSQVKLDSVSFNASQVMAADGTFSDVLVKHNSGDTSQVKMGDGTFAQRADIDANFGPPQLITQPRVLSCNTFGVQDAVIYGQTNNFTARRGTYNAAVEIVDTLNLTSATPLPNMIGVVDAISVRLTETATNPQGTILTEVTTSFTVHGGYAQTAPVIVANNTQPTINNAVSFTVTNGTYRTSPNATITRTVRYDGGVVTGNTFTPTGLGNKTLSLEEVVLNPYYNHTAFSNVAITVLGPIPTVLAEYLVVGGGGSGGGGTGPGGGGGAGRMLSGVNLSVTYPFSVTVGNGGAAPTGGAAGNNGSASVLRTVTAAGGGRGANLRNVSAAGGSGGGGSCMYRGTVTQCPGGSGIAPGGSSGGSGSTTVELASAAGGGGAAAGLAGTGDDGSTTYVGPGGAGGLGLMHSITGTSTGYAGGGGGGTLGATRGLASATYGGGNGANATLAGVAGVTNKGGGGGGGNSGNGGAGGRGVVAFAYDASYRNLNISSGLVYTLNTTARPGVKIYRFTSGTGTVNST